MSAVARTAVIVWLKTVSRQTSRFIQIQGHCISGKLSRMLIAFNLFRRRMFIVSLIQKKMLSQYFHWVMESLSYYDTQLTTYLQTCLQLLFRRALVHQGAQFALLTYVYFQLIFNPRTDRGGGGYPPPGGFS